MKSTRFYKVRLLNGHKANENQVIEGYLGNNFDNGQISEYSRGEAIKKARVFGGTIELSREERYAFINVEVQDEDRRYNNKETFSYDAELDLDELAEDHVKESGNGKEEYYDSDTWYWDSLGETMSRVLSCKEVSREEYDILKKYI